MGNVKGFMSALLFALVLLGLIASCGGEGQPSEAPAPAATPTTATVEMTPTGVLSPSPAADLDGEQLVQDRCTLCHSLARLQAVSKTEDQWYATVDRMMGYGAELNDEEREILVRYLVENYGP